MGPPGINIGLELRMRTIMIIQVLTDRTTTAGFRYYRQLHAELIKNAGSRGIHIGHEGRLYTTLMHQHLSTLRCCS